MEFIRQLVAFCILMENGQGIAVKSPGYIEGKWIQCANAPDETVLTAILDMGNRAKYQAWIDTWVTPKPAAPQEAPAEPEPGPEEEPPTREEVKTFLEEEVASSPRKRRGKHDTHDQS